MVAPVAVKAAIAVGPKGLLRIVGGALAVLLGAVLTPLALVFSLATMAPAALAVGNSDGPMIVGDWGKPEAAGYQVRRWYGLGGDEDCAICGRFHSGVDIGTQCGTPIYAIGPGIVARTEWINEYGFTVIVDHGGGVRSWYGHMPAGGFTVTPGQTVKAGTQLGVEGTTGNSTGCHVHLEMRVNDSRIDPKAFLASHGVFL